MYIQAASVYCISSKILQAFPSFLLEVRMDFRKTKHKHCIAAGIALHVVEFFSKYISRVWELTTFATEMERKYTHFLSVFLYW